MRIPRAVTVLALLTAPALVQSAFVRSALAQEAPHVNLVPEIQHKTPEEKEQDAIKQKAYQDSLRKIPDAKVSNDPWGSVRSAETPASAAPKKSHAKTKGHAAN